MEHFKKLMAKKKAEGTPKLDPIELAAHQSVLGGLKNALDSDGIEKVKGLKKVTVAAKDTPHLQEGLDKAKEIVDGGEKEIEGGDEDENDLLEHELEESPEYSDEESEEALEDSPDNHVHAAEAHDPLSMHAPSVESLSKEVESLKAELAKMKAPKSFY